MRSEVVAATGGALIRTFSGIAKASQETDLSFRIAGAIEVLSARVGERIRAGQEIARLDPIDFEIRVQQAQADLAQAQANARNTSSNLDRVRELWENDNTSKNDLDTARALDESARAQVQSSRKVLESAERKRGYTSLTAPVDGSIAEVMVEVNENVAQGQPVVMLTSGSRPEVEIAVPGVLIARVKEGETVSVEFDSLPGYRYAAVVTEVGVAATGTATTYPVTLRLVQGHPAIRSGMAADVTFQFGVQDEGTLFVPAVAVGEDREGRFVYLLEETVEPEVGVVHRRAVQVDNELSLSGIRILSGISEGDRVVTAGVRRLRDGQRVRLMD